MDLHRQFLDLATKMIWVDLLDCLGKHKYYFVPCKSNLTHIILATIPKLFVKII